jgi:hypothetical protein
MPITEELEALSVLQPAQQPTIITTQCSYGWIARLACEPCYWESGGTEAEAIGKLHKLHQDVLGLILRVEE